MKNKPILIVSGETRSIFFEIFFKSIKRKKYRSPIILICNHKYLLSQMKKFKFNKKVKIFEISSIKKAEIDNNCINLINVDFTKSDKKNNSYYIKKCFNVAIDLIKKKYTYKFINGPINKKTFLKNKFLGITEFISSRFKEKNIGMLIYNKNLSVCPLTTHLPLKLVSSKITKNLIINKLKLIDKFYKKHLKFKPKIAVTGLNPHCESISKFNEDEKIVSVAIKLSQKKKIHVKGPFPADTIFLKKNRDEFNVILGMYHDQVLTPLKTLYEYNAINLTMGLPFLRVTPDHGPNKQMYGLNQSNPQSLIEALNFLDKK